MVHHNHQAESHPYTRPVKHLILWGYPDVYFHLSGFLILYSTVSQSDDFLPLLRCIYLGPDVFLTSPLVPVAYVVIEVKS